MKNIVIVTAKGGNTSIENKNLIPILGVPVLVHAIRAAKLSSKTEGIYVSTEDALIKSLSEKEGVKIIHRPLKLSNPSSLHKDVIKHAVDAALLEDPEIENVIVLLGNTAMTPPALIDRAFGILEEGEADSCLSVWKAQDDHPYRALKLNDKKYVEAFHDLEVGSNRQSYPEVYFYDQGVWAFKTNCALEQKGPAPWVWLGQKCRMIERPWVTGRDIHSWIDISASVWYLNSIQTHDFDNFIIH